MVDVAKREDRLLDKISALVHRREMTVLQITLNEYAYPELKAVWDDLRACLEGADRDS